jgi:hypothetical protein
VPHVAARITTKPLNEYMTWAVFLLYAAERLSADDFVRLKEQTVSIMKKGRGFRAFDVFADKAISLRKTSERKIEAMIPDLIAWSRDQAETADKFQ